MKGVEPGMKIAFERVLATLVDDVPTFGMPYVTGARVEATVLENFKDRKLIVFKYRPKVGLFLTVCSLCTGVPKHCHRSNKASRYQLENQPLELNRAIP
jgi:hypothetical protein